MCVAQSRLESLKMPAVRGEALQYCANVLEWKGGLRRVAALAYRQVKPGGIAGPRGAL